MQKLELRDRSGVLLGWIEIESSGLHVGRGRRGTRVGEYNPKDNVTRDCRGAHVGTGDMLASLITNVGS